MFVGVPDFQSVDFYFKSSYDLRSCIQNFSVGRLTRIGVVCCWAQSQSDWQKEDNCILPALDGNISFIVKM